MAHVVEALAQVHPPHRRLGIQVGKVGRRGASEALLGVFEVIFPVAVH